MPNNVVHCSEDNLRAHLRAVAAEEGVELDPVQSCQERVVLKDGRTLEIWYDEVTSSAFAWKGFVAGVGEKSGRSRAEVINEFGGV